MMVHIRFTYINTNAQAYVSYFHNPFTTLAVQSQVRQGRPDHGLQLEACVQTLPQHAPLPTWNPY